MKPIIPNHNVVAINKITYTLFNFAINTVGIKMAAIMIKPPIVGVPFF